ncbi:MULTISPECIES: deoxynucleoside kinase [unclassified Paenibacillus]|uniref:deoxynucleoside kinase n=1 Tax=unclassified Paenibacillus TaxID=185978 RepID=UPI002404DA43|nr:MULTISPECIES: deoxynucleoside kinase [unclassified Paenibacillus]MDF9842264.1 deoxyguanosine kinase [Paenibacillus sp. PastF-2]MDF9848859.1 deoxyguanosine kinase [Paenibacillus sp. PastM-2]MDF9855429.1 deoxyguanosine kinase [Paenibacillus sp. PastF-1]MDH6480695.1 deoxyguanosine kinase [Paenibacillus sp. PastH-2]MDH6508124.1 deoxyguanosine kinase [Paenibacillus sp. PastM-3]
MKHAPFIAVEGPIGAGKTTLATMLAAELELPMIKEIVEENPFLDKFYQNMDDWSFQLEMFFLCNRYKQLEDTVTEYIVKGKPVISDYHIYKNLIFSERTLKGTKRDKYREIYHVLTDDLPKPDIILYIRADLDTLLARIAKRARPFEEEISKAYLQQLIEDYDDAMAQLAIREPSTVIVTIDGNKVDFVENQEDYHTIAAQLKELMK